MSLFARKLRRELLAQRGQALAVIIVTAIGVLLFVSSAGSYRDLRDSYASTRERLALADWHVDVTSLTSTDVTRIAADPAIGAVEGRVVTALPASVEHGAEHARLQLRLISLPEGHAQPALDRILVDRGHLPSNNDEILVEKHLALHHRLAPGSTVTVTLGGVSRALRVAGIGVSAEYLWVARSAVDPMPSPETFGVAWMPRAGLRALANEVEHAMPAAADGLPGLAVAASDSPGNQLLVERAHGASASSALQAARAVLGDARISAATAEDQLVGVRLLQMDVDGYKGMAAFFPVFFLGVAAFIVAAVLGRLVDAQRPIIGTFVALGVSRARILAHYVTWALTLGAVGGVVGAIAGFVVTRALTREYALELGIPFVATHTHPGLMAIGIALGCAMSIIAGALPAFRASRLAPAEAMRAPKPRSGPWARAVRNLPAPLAVRMALRDVLGRPGRSFATALGVAAALVLVLTTAGMVDSMRATVRTMFGDAQRFDLRIDLAAPTTGASLRAALSAIDGVRRVETLVALPARIEANGRAADVVLRGIEPDASLLRAADLDGHVVRPTHGAIVMTRSSAHRLGVSIGDAVRVAVPGLAQPVTVRVGAFADATMGDVATVPLDELQQVAGEGDLVTSAVMAVDPSRLEQVRSVLAQRTDIARVQDLAALRAQIDALMGLGWVMIGVMLVFSVVLAAAILYNTATLGILERRRELATLRALGMTFREIAARLTLEHFVLALGGLAIGLPLAALSTRRVLASFSNDLFRLPFVPSPSTAAVGAFGVLLVLFVAQWPALRQVARESLASAVRTREG